MLDKVYTEKSVISLLGEAFILEKRTYRPNWLQLKYQLLQDRNAKIYVDIRLFGSLIEGSFYIAFSAVTLKEAVHYKTEATEGVNKLFAYAKEHPLCRLRALTGDVSFEHRGSLFLGRL